MIIINDENSCASSYFVETYTCFQDSLMNRKFKGTTFICNRNTYVFTITFDQFNVSFLDKSLYFFLLIQKNTDLNVWTVV